MNILIGIGIVLVILLLAFLARVFFYHRYVIYVDPPDMPGFSVIYECWGRSNQNRIDRLIEFEKIEHKAALFGMTLEEREEAEKQALERLREMRRMGKSRFRPVFPEDGKKWCGKGEKNAK